MIYPKFEVILVQFLFLTTIYIESKSTLKKPTKLSSCKAQLDDGSIVDLTSLDNAASPRTAQDKNYNYVFNPCSPITCASGVQASSAVCQKAKASSLKYNLGDQSTADFSYDGSNLIITFSSGIRTTELTCKCSTSEDFSYLGENPENNYDFTFSSPCCCPDGCTDKPNTTKKPGGSGGGLSGGSVLLIIFFSLLFVYFVGGVIFMKFIRHETGAKAIPNVEFWTSIPGYTKAGFSFVVSKFRGNTYSQI